MATYINQYVTETNLGPVSMKLFVIGNALYAR